MALLLFCVISPLEEVPGATQRCDGACALGRVGLLLVQVVVAWLRPFLHVVAELWWWCCGYWSTILLLLFLV